MALMARLDLCNVPRCVPPAPLGDAEVLPFYFVPADTRKLMHRPQATPQPRLRCFVAMAFDKPDTDEIFGGIDETLNAMGIKAVRVDRIEHNDDIDNRLISELESADFVLADLTYSRPSVYFEAGYAQRKVPVIYTVRRDHLRPTLGDEHGNLRVHFDLQMKNIIPWTNAADTVFEK